MAPPQKKNLMSGDPSVLLKTLIIDFSILAVRISDIERAINWDSVLVSLALRSNVKYHVLLHDLSATAIIIPSNKLKRPDAIQKLKLLQLKQFPNNWNLLSAVQSIPLPALG
jgi:hypothetical protein